MSIKYDDIEKYVVQIASKYIALREDLHVHPELGRQEFRTSEHLRETLREFGYESIEMVGKTGFTTDLITRDGAPLIALRADIDALPITDKKNVPYKSIHNGICHACGHDFHSAVVAGVAETLSHFKNYLKGNIRFIFQHAEEPIPGGALEFVEKGRLEGVRAVFGLHADPDILAGQIGLRTGWINAQSIHIKIRIDGPGGHSARPHETADPIFLGSQLLNMLYSFLSRNQNPENPFVFTIGKVTGGDAYNSIANRFEAEGTLRVSQEKSGNELLKNIDNIVKKITYLSSVSINFEYTKGAPPVVNDEKLTNQVREIIEPIVSSDHVQVHPRSMGGEDFSHYLCQAPGVFLRFGVGSSDKNTRLHTGDFDIEKKAIPFAISLFSWILLNILERMGDRN